MNIPRQHLMWKKGVDINNLVSESIEGLRKGVLIIGAYGPY